MSTAQRRRRQVDALVALLSNLGAGQLEQILERLEVKGAVALEHKDAPPDRRCNVCGKTYPMCRRLAEATGDDHEFEART